ncbi:MAG: N-acetyltransferase [Planctomycetes bacterium]|nr:N-acetyltransferase [Planctomycetota bacterium]
MIDPSARIHPTALVEDGAHVGARTAVWDSAHLRSGARIGRDCIVGEKTYVAGGATIGDLCKLNAQVYVCAGVTIEDGVMLSAHVVFTNDLLPRACDTAMTALRPSEPDEHTLSTTVRRGATVGANATIGPGLVLGAFCMVGMGSVVTRDVPDHALVVGNPARIVGLVARDGTRVWSAPAPGRLPPDGAEIPCPDGRVLRIDRGRVSCS